MIRIPKNESTIPNHDNSAISKVEYGLPNSILNNSAMLAREIDFFTNSNDSRYSESSINKIKSSSDASVNTINSFQYSFSNSIKTNEMNFQVLKITEKSSISQS